ncbi:MAG TPA: HD domain-containing protein [Firmicutes bacterium]|jgi:metal-dependent HD superfamily phosphatase/phosphodiesterase|nr:MAG: phosphohydrolase [Peptococcaceae bacterium 1109]HHT73113.1 HD domain-containing protein [Bacillota bacterium]
MTVSFKDVQSHPFVEAFVNQADANLEALGYTEHGKRHVGLVSSIARNILRRLGYPERTAELAAIAGYVHDIGNSVSRIHHGPTAAVLIAPVLQELQMPPHEIAQVLSAVGNHEEETGHPVNAVAAALILADKSDVHRTRTRSKELTSFDIHDRVNYAAVKSFLDVDETERVISLNVTIDTEICPIMEYFEIFLQRMLMCRRAAEFLGCQFKLNINDTPLL